MPSLLSLDCSTSVGWSFWTSADAMPRCGTWKAPKSWSIEDYGKRFQHFHDWLCDMLTTMQPEMLAFEGPVIPRAGMRDLKTSEHIMRTLIGLVSVAELVANLRGIRCFEVHVSTAKSVLTGNGRADKTDMIAEAVKRGWPVGDDHQADACAVALVVYDMLGESVDA